MFCNRIRPTESSKFYSRSHHAVIRAYGDAGNVIERHEHKAGLQNLFSRLAMNSLIPSCARACEA
jgi:hypothetical protein